MAREGEGSPQPSDRPDSEPHHSVELSSRRLKQLQDAQHKKGAPWTGTDAFCGSHPACRALEVALVLAGVVYINRIPPHMVGLSAQARCLVGCCLHQWSA